MAQTLVKISAADLKKARAARAPSASNDSESVNKSALIRSLPASLPAAEVVAQAAKQGVTITANLVYMVRGRGPARSSKKERSTSKRTIEAAERPVALEPRRAARAAPPTEPRRKPGRPARTPMSPANAPLNDAERRLAAFVLELGLQRVEQLLGQLRRALAQV